ncbi:MAG: IclR family transcriptional regulator [Nitrospirae bacterium]|nr:IclR family transcriptional regulator [Nitrospirota bacterium]
MKRKKDPYAILSILKGLEILESFSKSDQAERGVSDLAKRVGLSKNQVFRVLATLMSRGYVEQNRSTENYRLGPKVVDLCRAFTSQASLARLPRTFLEEARERVGETVLLGVTNGSKAVCVDGVEGNQPVRVAPLIGALLPLHASALGKAQVAFLSTAEIERALPKELAKYTSRTLTDRRKLLDDLVRAAHQGWALEDEEYMEGVRSVAAPVYDYTPRVVGSVAVVAPAYRMTEDDLRKAILPGLLQVAGQLSQRLGYTPSPSAAPGA